MAAKKNKSESYAEHLYVNEGWSQKAIADYIDVSERTILTWKQKGKWDDQKNLIAAAPHTIKLKLLTELEKISKGEDSNIDADALSKIVKAIDTLSDKISIQVIMSVFKEFDLFVVDINPQIAVEFTKYHRDFILHKINIDG